MPASAPDKLAKAAGRGADEVVIDLEDAVAAAVKDVARAAAVEALNTLDWSGVAVAVRVNARGTQWRDADLAALAAAPGALGSIVLPKAERAEDVVFAARLLDDAPAGGSLRLQALIETAAGLARAHEVAAASPRLAALVIGYADLAVSLGRSAAGAADVTLWDPVRELVLLAARVNGLQAIDGPHLGIAADEPFAAAARRARDQGFDGKWAIHPSQLGPLRETFSPTEGDVAHARAVIDALAAAEAAGQGAAALDGQMLDEPVRLAALRVLAAAGEVR